MALTRESLLKVEVSVWFLVVFTHCVLSSSDQPLLILFSFLLTKTSCLKSMVVSLPSLSVMVPCVVYQSLYGKIFDGSIC
jgi:hypothetical protein